MSDPAPVYLVHGNDRVKVLSELARIRDAIGSSDSSETFDASSSSAEDVVASARMRGLFQQLRMLTVTAVDQWKTPDVDELLQYLEDPEPETVLVLAGSQLPARSRLLKACSTPPGEVVECAAPEAKSMPQWVVEAFQQRGVTVNRAAAQQLVSMLGGDSLARIDSEVERLVTYAAGEPITATFIERATEPDLDMKIWVIADAWATRDRGRLLQVTEQLLEASEAPIAITIALARHIRTVHQARRMLTDSSADQVAAQLPGHPFVAKKCVQQAQQVSLPRLDASLARVALLEAELKGDAPLASQAARTVFQRGVAELV